MLRRDIKEYEIGKHCFGEILRINGEDFNDIDKGEMIEFIVDFLKNDENGEVLLYDILKTTLDYMEYDQVENSNSVCEQCGDWNYYTKYVDNEKEETD